MQHRPLWSQNMDKGNRAASYPDDTWELSGSLNLETTPYAIHFGVDIDKPGGPISIYIPNAFLDWGDGSGVVPLEIDVSSPVSYQQVPLGRTYQHKYTRSGNFNRAHFLCFLKVTSSRGHRMPWSPPMNPPHQAFRHRQER